MDTIDPLSVLPAPWLAAVEHYAPHVLAWLLIATVLVHLLVPIARAVERWAIASSVTWDDGPARRFASIVEWLAGALRAVLAFLPRLAIGRRDMKPENVSRRRLPTRISPSHMETPPPKTGEIGHCLMCSEPGPVGSDCAHCPCAYPIASDRRPPRAPSGGAGLALALIIVAAACSVLTSGCSGGAAAAGPIAITARDVTCRGGRVVCRLVDRVCRGTGGPWVVPRSAEEVASDAASRLTRAEPDESAEGEEGGNISEPDRTADDAALDGSPDAAGSNGASGPRNIPGEEGGAP